MHVISPHSLSPSLQDRLKPDSDPCKIWAFVRAPCLAFCLSSLSVALHKLLGVVMPCFLEAVRAERERQVVMGVLEAMNSVVKTCQGEG